MDNLIVTHIEKDLCINSYKKGHAIPMSYKTLGDDIYIYIYTYIYVYILLTNKFYIIEL